MSIGNELIANFARIVRSGGGAIHLLDEEGGTIRIGFVPGDAEPCESGACVLPHLELQEMMREWLARRAPEACVKVVLQQASEA